MLPDRAACRFGIAGAWLTIAGIVVSGPVGLAVVSMVHRPSRWTGPEAFVRAFHPVQAIPFFGGFALILGCLMVMSAISSVANPSQRPRATASIIATAGFVALILFNYVCQTTLIPALVRADDPNLGPIISTFSLQNPRSIGWAIEMWGYACLGAATWFAAVVFDQTRVERAVARLMVANGVTSLVAAIITSARLEWVLSGAGLAAYVVWNVLMLALSILLVMAFRQRAGPRSPVDHRPSQIAAR